MLTRNIDRGPTPLWARAHKANTHNEVCKTKRCCGSGLRAPSRTESRTGRSGQLQRVYLPLHGPVQLPLQQPMHLQHWQVQQVMQQLGFALEMVRDWAIGRTLPADRGESSVIRVGRTSGSKHLLATACGRLTAGGPCENPRHHRARLRSVLPRAWIEPLH